MSYEIIQQQLDKSWRLFDSERINFLCEVMTWLSHPDKDIRIIQIAGTNGKGSTGAMLREIILASGETVGHFTSPAVFNDCEQIWLNGNFVSQEAWVTAYEDLNYQLTQHNLTIANLSYFEVWTIVALLIFRQNKVTYAIIEAGLGGRDDATHMISYGDIVAYTEIGLDHQNILGHNIESIAQNKADLITGGTLVVSDLEQVSAVTKILKRTAKREGAHWFEQHDTISIQSETVNGLCLVINQQRYQLGLNGAFQRRNAAVVWQVLSALELRYQVSFNIAARQKGLANSFMVGRMQVDTTNRLVWDGAHNIDAVRALLETVKVWQLSTRPILILGVLSDKNYDDMLAYLLPVFSEIIAVTPDNPRALAAEDLADTIKKLAPNMTVTPVASQEALALAQQKQGKNQYIMITGSFYTLRSVGEHYA